MQASPRARHETHGVPAFGGPGETRESVEESLAFADSLDLDSLKISIGIRIYPHTRFADQARREGAIGEKDDSLVPDPTWHPVWKAG